MDLATNSNNFRLMDILTTHTTNTTKPQQHKEDATKHNTKAQTQIKHRTFNCTECRTLNALHIEIQKDGAWKCTLLNIWLENNLHIFQQESKSHLGRILLHSMATFIQHKQTWKHSPKLHIAQWKPWLAASKCNDLEIFALKSNASPIEWPNFQMVAPSTKQFST
jgi:hypothetical protein